MFLPSQWISSRRHHDTLGPSIHPNQAPPLECNTLTGSVMIKERQNLNPKSRHVHAHPTRKCSKVDFMWWQIRAHWSSFFCTRPQWVIIHHNAPLGYRFFCDAHIVFESFLKEETEEYIFSTFSRAFQQDVHCCEYCSYLAQILVHYFKWESLSCSPSRGFSNKLSFIITLKKKNYKLVYLILTTWH